MLVHNGPLFRIFFGNADNGLFPFSYANLSRKQPLKAFEPFFGIAQTMYIKKLFFLRQVHGSEQVIVTQDKQFLPFKKEGDCLITRDRNVGLGIISADCLPIVLYDVRNNVVSIMHAGWKGSVARIVQKTISNMHTNFDTQIEDLKVFFGPSAKSCCYIVGKDFSKELEDFPFIEKVLSTKRDQFFFDLPGFNQLQLMDLGIKKEAICIDYNSCTICNEKFYSYRRLGRKDGQQITMVSLK